MQLSEMQSDGLDLIESWIEGDEVHNDQLFYLAGYAGTGKTTLIGELLRRNKDLHALHAAYTGKAALQMRKNGVHDARTVHSLIYRLVELKGGQMKFELNEESDLLDADLLVLDECSMIDRDIGNDLLSFGKPILFVGDQAQLPPVKGEGYFTSRTPDVELTEVHRQALESGIIKVATDVRNGLSLTRQEYEDAKIYSRSLPIGELLGYDQVICGKNVTRRSFNKRARAYFRRVSTPYPVKGDKVICLRNNAKEGLTNGLIGYVTEAAQLHDGGYVELTFVDDADNEYTTKVHRECFTAPDELSSMEGWKRRMYNEFDYGYAITCHKAQGSQWDRVAVLDDGMFVWDPEMRQRWLYTAVTRAARDLFVTKQR